MSKITEKQAEQIEAMVLSTLGVTHVDHPIPANTTANAAVAVAHKAVEICAKKAPAKKVAKKAPAKKAAKKSK